MRVGRKIGEGSLTAITYIGLVVFMIPFFWTLAMAFKTPDVYWTYPVQWWPKDPTLDNFRYIFFSTKIGRYLSNSLMAAGLNTILVLAVSAPAAYGIIRFKIGGDNLSFWFLSQRMAPPIAMAIPMFLLMKTVSLLDNVIGLILVYCVFNVGFAVWMMMSFFADFPVELEDAALIDGCTRMGMLRRIILPISAPNLVVTGIFTFIFAWSEFVMTFILTRENAKTITVQLVSFQVPTEPLWGELSAMLMIAIIPIAILVLSVQRYLVTGLTSGAIKG
jgi:multiple sugar transport system permease protein